MSGIADFLCVLAGANSNSARNFYLKFLVALAALEDLARRMSAFNGVQLHHLIVPHEA
jgi:hypothetical protein